MMMLLLLIVFFVRHEANCLSDYYVIQMPVDDPPNNRIPLNSPPMQVYWNVPTMQCTSKKILFQNLYEKFGIIQNQGDSFRGDRIAILYDPGIFPAIFKNDTNGRLRFRNGGVPQEGDLEKHLDAFSNILNQSIPDEKFNGVGIIDFESWRPIYRQNFGELSPYKDVSYEIERSNHWWWPSSMVTAEAKRRFEESARTFMGKTLVLAKQMRPLAQWGYYAFPYCFNSKSDRCAAKVHSENDYISWLWSESTALYPSVYSSKDLSPSQLSQVVKGRVNEAARVKRAHGVRGAPILPYFWFRYRDGGYMKEEDLETTLKTFDNSDASGFIIWGSSNDVNTLEKCVKLSNYVEKVLGPAIAKYTKRQITINDEEQYVITTEMYNKNESVIDANDDRNTSTINESVEENHTEFEDTNNGFIAINNNDQNDNLTTAHENGSEISVDNSNDSVLNKIVLNDETLLFFNENTTTVSPEGSEANKNNNKDIQSSFSLYSVPNAFGINNFGEKYGLTTTENAELKKTTTEVFDFSTETDTLNPEYHWDPPENYTQDIEKYVKEEFIEKLQSKYNKSDKKDSEPVVKEYNHNNTLIDLLLDSIFQYKTVVDDLKENKGVGNNITIVKSKNELTSKEKVYGFTTIANDYDLETQSHQEIEKLVNLVTEATNVGESNTEEVVIQISTNLTEANSNITDNTTDNPATEEIVKSDEQVEYENTFRKEYTTEYSTVSSSDFTTDVNKKEIYEKDKVAIMVDESLENNKSHLSDTNEAKNTAENKSSHNGHIHSNESTDDKPESSAETSSSTMHKMKKKHHSRHRKKGRARCHHMTEEETTTSTTTKPDKRPTSLKEDIHHIKELIIPKIFQDNPMSEELTSPDSTVDQVLVSLV